MAVRSFMAQTSAVNTIDAIEFSKHAEGEFAIKDAGQKKFGILVMNDPYGVGIAKAMRKVIEQEGGDVVSEVRYELNKAD